MYSTSTCGSTSLALYIRDAQVSRVCTVTFEPDITESGFTSLRYCVKSAVL